MSRRIPIRRVVTGHDVQGRAVISMDGEPPHVYEISVPGTFFTEIWRTQESPAAVDNGTDPTVGLRKMTPDASGSVIRVVQIAPEAETSMPASAESIRAVFEGLGSAEAGTAASNAPHPLMHRTETVDYGIVLEGEVTLILDDSETTLYPGDIVVQRGTNHAWANRGDKPCRIVFVLLDGKYAEDA